MRLTESKLRAVIRKELQKSLHEMAHMGTMGVSRGDWYKPDENPEEVLEPLSVFSKREMAAAEKYARSSRFAKLADKLFANLPINIWTAALIGRKSGERSEYYELNDENLERLASLGFDTSKPFGPDDTIILGIYGSADKGTLGTPWMTFHALFDAYNFESPIMEKFSNLYGLVTEDEEFGGRFMESGIRDAMTMGAARDAKEGRGIGLESEDDVLAELMVQELLDRRGVRFDLENIEPQFHPFFDELTVLVKEAAQAIRDTMIGKIVVVSVN